MSGAGEPPGPPAGLDGLLALLETRALWRGAPLAGGVPDTDRLPAFGGEPPRQPQDERDRALSWDEGRALAGDPASGDFRIVARGRWGALCAVEDAEAAWAEGRAEDCRGSLEEAMEALGEEGLEGPVGATEWLESAIHAMSEDPPGGWGPEEAMHTAREAVRGG